MNSADSDVRGNSESSDVGGSSGDQKISYSRVRLYISVCTNVKGVMDVKGSENTDIRWDLYISIPLTLESPLPGYISDSPQSN